MLSKFMKNSGLAIAALGAAMIGGMQAYAADGDTFTGNIGVFSKYVLRGITESPENNDTAVQGGLDYSFANGIYLGYWGSNLGYRWDPDNNNDQHNDSGFENDFYAGYNGKVGDFGYQIGLIQYYYMNVDDSNLEEALLGISYGPVYAGMQYLLRDGYWGNQGDIYWKAGINYDLPRHFKFNGELGWYTYEKDDNDKLGTKIAGLKTTESSAFRYVTLTLSHPIGNTGADMLLTYIIGGRDRTGDKQGNTAVLGVKFNFDVT